MYNQYIPQGQPFAPIPFHSPPESGGDRGAAEKLRSQITSVLKGIGLERLDTGDLLLVLVILLLWKEEENTDLLLALGAAFFLGREDT